MKLNFAVICFKECGDNEMEIMHTCCYESEPSSEDVQSLEIELAEVEEFGMVGDTDYKMVLLNRSIPEESDLMDSLGIPLELEPEEE